MGTDVSVFPLSFQLFAGHVIYGSFLVNDTQVRFLRYCQEVQFLRKCSFCDIVHRSIAFWLPFAPIDSLIELFPNVKNSIKCRVLRQGSFNSDILWRSSCRTYRLCCSCVNFIYEFRYLNLKVDSDPQFYEKLFKFHLLSEYFFAKICREKSRKEYFSFLLFLLV